MVLFVFNWIIREDLFSVNLLESGLVDTQRR